MQIPSNCQGPSRSRNSSSTNTDKRPDTDLPRGLPRKDLSTIGRYQILPNNVGISRRVHYEGQRRATRKRVDVSSNVNITASGGNGITCRGEIPLGGGGEDTALSKIVDTTCFATTSVSEERANRSPSKKVTYLIKKMLSYEAQTKMPREISGHFWFGLTTHSSRLQGNIARPQSRYSNLLRCLNVNESGACNGKQLTRRPQCTNHQIPSKRLNRSKDGRLNNGRLSIRLKQLHQPWQR